MSDYLPCRYLAALSALAVLGASAQPASPTPPQPTAPARMAPAAQAGTTPYRSAFESYRPYSEEKVLPWTEANDTVRANGGWREYAREANEEPAKPLSAPAGPADPAGHAKP